MAKAKESFPEAQEEDSDFLTIFTFIFSLLTITFGYIFGDSYLSKILGKYASMVSGLIIIILGLYEIYS